MRRSGGSLNRRFKLVKLGFGCGIWRRDAGRFGAKCAVGGRIGAEARSPLSTAVRNDFNVNTSFDAGIATGSDGGVTQATAHAACDTHAAPSC